MDFFPAVRNCVYNRRARREQRAQFILVNSTKPLPKGLVYELLPYTNDPLPPSLMRKRFPSFDGRAAEFRRGLTLLPVDSDTDHLLTGLFKGTSILRMLENSLTNGCLYYFRDPNTGSGDIEEMLLII